ncbi:MAG: hypothetical protein FJ135_13660 [Deltaproteobacteria bacterium]|nr:hypothetical protein [Deltaproteobacteria bacterium]
MAVISSLTKRFRIVQEESWYHEKSEIRKPDRRWYEIIPLKGFVKGPSQEGPFIGLYSEAPPTLQLYTTRVKQARIIWKKIKKIPGCRADFHLDGEAVLYFPPELLEQVAEMAGARKRRQLSEEHRAKLIEAGEKGRAALQIWKKSRVQDGEMTREEEDTFPAKVTFR